MKTKYLLTCLAVALMSASAASAGVIADWTFETSIPASTNAPNVPSPTYAAEVGTGSALGLHSGATGNTIYGSTAGNGSTHSFSANNWAMGDYYQFTFATTGLSNITVSMDSVASGTGPKDFNVAYSIDGANFTNFGTFTNTNSISWSTTSSNVASTHFYDLSSVAALNNQTIVYIRAVVADNAQASGTGVIASGGTARIDNVIASGTSGIVVPPSISSITPSLTTNASANVTFTVAATGDAPLFYFWFKGATFLTGQTNTTLTLSNVLAADAATYSVVVSNSSSINATGMVTLTVTDPAFLTQPDPTQNLVQGATAQFTVAAAGTGTLSYLWCTGDPVVTDNAFVPVVATARITGVASPTLQITGLTSGDVNNYFCIVSNSLGGSVVSTPVSMTVVTTAGTLAFWDFNGFFDTNAPASTVGAGAGAILNIQPFVLPAGASQDNNDLVPENLPPIIIANHGWGTDNYPAATVSNLSGGVQFNVSTLGAKNVKIGYDVREISGSSKFIRLQYTTNGTDWTNFPATTDWGLNILSKFNNTPPTYDLTGFKGVANNPNFGFRLVAEFISTATYGANPTNSYVGASNTTYSASATVSYDLVKVTADSIIGTFAPPTINPVVNQSIPDIGGPFNVTVSGSGSGTLTFTASSYNNNIVSASASGNTVSLSPVSDGTAPVSVTVTDSTGDSATTSFLVSVVPNNQPPVVTGLFPTNTLANKPLVIHFTVADDHTLNLATASVTSSNGTVLLNSSLSAVNTGTATLTLTPVTNQTGVIPLTVTVNDNDPTLPKITTVNFTLDVLPNTNTYLDDTFTYDGSGSVITNSGGLWVNHSGTQGQMQVGAGILTVNGASNSEDVSALLIGAPFPTNTSAVLFSRYDVVFTHLPDLESGSSGAYISHFKDLGTFNFWDKVVAATNGAAPGMFRLGVGDGPNITTTNAIYLTQDLALNTSYTVVTEMVLSNALSTIWVNPLNTNSVSATDTNVAAVTNLSNVYMYAFRESFGGGTAQVSNLRIGKSFEDVVDVLDVVQAGTNVVVTWNNTIFTLQASTNVLGTYTNIVGATSPYTNALSPNLTKFFRLHSSVGLSGN